MNGPRLMRGIGANLLSIATRIVVQFATLPLFFAHWRAEQVGVWLLIFALPAYVAIIGTGFAGAGGSASVAAARRGDLADARARFAAAWAVTAAGTAIFAGIFFLAGEQLSAAWLAADMTPAARQDVSSALGWLALYILASSQMAMADIPFRVAERYPTHIVLASFATLAEVAIVAVVVALSEALADLAMALALARCVLAAVILVYARKACPQLFARANEWAGRHIRSLAKPSLAFMAMPIVFGINLQGYLLLVGARYGAASAAAFAATRALTRLLDLFANLTFGVQYYESGYLDGDRRCVQRRLLATMTLAAGIVSLSFSALLLAFGSWLQTLYTVGETRFDPLVAGILLCAAGLRAFASAPVAIIAAENRHAPVVSTYLAGTVASLCLALALSMAGAPLAICLIGLVFAEASQLVAAMRAALRDLDLSAAQFLRSLRSRERVADFAVMLHLLQRNR